MLLPKNETRIFNTEILKNGIKTIYVEDKELDKTIISVSVNIGSYANPKDCQGLAHFLEHMLFLGSKKYPEEDYYEKSVKKYGGFSNAYTELFETVYYFSVFNNGLEHTMDIFSRFFIDPLFNEESVLREINAVHSEHDKNINDDHWRIHQMLKNVADIDNPYNTFPTGSKFSMDEKTIRSKMIEFYNKYYVSENISICIISNLDMKQQKNLIYKTFGNIQNKKAPELIIQKPIYENDKMYQIIPVSDLQQLIYVWEINKGENKLINIINDLLVNGSKNSLTNFLKINGWIESVFCNIQEDVGIFSVYFILTKIGLTKIKEIDGMLKYFFNILFDKNWEEIILYYQKLYQINFDNMDKEEPSELAIYLSVNCHKYPLKYVYSGPHLIRHSEKYIDYYNKSKEEMKSFFNKNTKLLVNNSKIDKIITDKNYGTEYCEIKNINSDILPFTVEININNPFLDLNAKLLKVDDSKVPILVRDKVWYAGSSKFGEPIIKGALIFNNIKFYNSERNYLLTNLAVSCLGFYLTQELYNIFTLQFNVSVALKNIYNSLVLNYSCPNDAIKFNQFINMTLELILTPNIPTKIIETKIVTLMESLINTNKENPWNYSSYYFTQQTVSNEYSIETLLKELKTIKPLDVINYIRTLFDNSSLSVLFGGNLTIDQLPNNPLINKMTFEQQNSFPKVKFLNNISINHPNKDETNSCLTITYSLGSFEPLKWVHTFLSYLILEQPFYDELRTKKQLGYLVKFTMANTGDNYYLVQKIQSNKKCSEIKKEIDIFNKNIINILNKENLDEWKVSARNYLEEKDNNVSDIFSKFYSEIISRKYLFDRKTILLKQLDLVTNESLIIFINEYMLNNPLNCVFELHGNIK